VLAAVQVYREKQAKEKKEHEEMMKKQAELEK
jgi:hypothetical protein